MPDVTGQRTTTNISSDQLAIDMGDRIRLLEPDSQPLTVFSRAASKRKTVATKFSWLEDEAEPRYDAVNGNQTDSDQSIEVDHGSYFAQHDLVLNTRTMEVFKVDSVSSNTLQVTRGLGSTAAAMLDNDELLKLGSAQPEGDTSKPARSDNPAKSQNYTQIFRTEWQASGSLLASAFQVQPADWPHQARKKGIEHAKDIEYAFLAGRKYAGASGATELRATGGLLSFITTNQTDAGGTLTEAEFNAFMAQVMRFGTRRKLAFASSVGVGALNKFPASKQMTRNDETTYGMDVTKYTSPFGSLMLVYHRLMEGSEFGGYIMVADVEELAYRWLGNDSVSRDTKLLPNRQENDRDGRKDEYLTEAGLEYGNEITHGVMTGITD